MIYLTVIGRFHLSTINPKQQCENLYERIKYYQQLLCDLQ